MLGATLTYSRFVTILKVALPLLALGLLSTLFLISNKITDSSASLPFAEVDLTQRAREQQITAPFFSGRTSAGHLVAFSAEAARPDPEDPARSSATKMDARLDLSDGTSITMSADHAEVDNGTHITRLTGGVIVTSSTGYEIRTEELVTHMRELQMVAPTAINGLAPGGTIAAGQLVIVGDKQSGETTLFFSEGVKLILKPGNSSR